jgi:hypothetical protein
MRGLAGGKHAVPRAELPTALGVVFEVVVGTWRRLQFVRSNSFVSRVGEVR